MSRLGCCVVLALWLAAAARGAQPVRPKPKEAAFLAKTKLWYLLHVPEKYDPKEPYPLVVVAPYRDDYAGESHNAWLELAKQDRLFLATLNFPPGSKEDREPRFCDLVEEVCKKYEGIDHKRLVFVGLEAGAVQVVRFIAEYPRVFALGLAVGPHGMPDLKDVKPKPKPHLVDSSTDLVVTYDPKSPTIRKALSDARSQIQRLHLELKMKPATPVGLGKPSDDEVEVVTKAIRELYTETKRAEVAKRLRQAAEEARKKKEEEQKKLAAAKAKEADSGKTEPSKEPGKTATEPAANPDDVLQAAQDAYDKRDLVKALALFRRLAKLRPDSDYARVANERIKELEGDPAIKRAVADAEVEKRAKPLLSLARSFRQVGDKAKAAEEFKKVVEQFPGTSFAEEAAKELKDLEGKE
jgi:TolA-binding protein